MRTIVAILLALLVCGPARAQAGQLRALALRYQEDRERLQGYDWKSRTAIAVDDRTEELALCQVHHNAQGKRSRTELREPAKKHRRAARFLEDLYEVLDSYTRFTPETVQTQFAAAKIFPEQDAGEPLLRVQIRGVVLDGDSMYVWAESFSHRLRRVEIETSLDGQPVRVVTEYRDLADGPTYAARMTVETELKKRPTRITIENFDHVRRGD